MGSPKVLKNKHLRQLKGERGSVMVETAIAFPFFMFLVAVGIVLVMSGYSSLVTQYAAVRATRTLVTGWEEDPTLRATQMRDDAIDFMETLGLDRNRLDICINTPNNANCAGGALDAGEPGEIVLVRIDYQIPLTMWGFDFDVRGIASGINERYATG